MSQPDPPKTDAPEVAADPSHAELLWRQWAMQQAVVLVVAGHASMSGIKKTAAEILKWVRETSDA